MLTKLYSDSYKDPVIIKNVDDKDVSSLGAFRDGQTIKYTLKVQRKLGASAVVMRINKDGESSKDIPLEFVQTCEGFDIYSTCLFEDTKVNHEGLYYYEFLLLRGLDTLFTSSINNVDFELNNSSGNKFRLTVYSKDFKTPEWTWGKTIYHIFVDRFCKGEGKVQTREDAIINTDWMNGIPQFPKENGDRYLNNVFFGGNLWGVIEELDYLKSIGVGIIYLSPIFKAFSNHKYDTGNYLEIDGMFGGDEAFKKLIEKADEKGIKIILDGVFNHTGDDSLYFDKYGKYGKTGAYTNPDSPFKEWYKFKEYPEKYESWWGIDILPKLNHENKECRDFFVGKNGVVDKYISMGIGGFRLDVADELSNDFLDELHETAKSRNPESIIIGEVWENAADKMSYGQRRRYFQGKQLDSVMNYPLKNAIIEYLRYKDASILADTMKEIYSSYPQCVSNCLMNILGTHDTERILTVLGGICDEKWIADGASNEELSKRKMTTKLFNRAKKLLKMAAVIQFTSYGIPSVYYGDEIGSEGYHDPFCRMPYKWGNEDKDLLEFYKKLGKIRLENPAFDGGDFEVVEVSRGFIAYKRKKIESEILVLVNRGDEDIEFKAFKNARNLLDGKKYDGISRKDTAYILG